MKPEKISFSLLETTSPTLGFVSVANYSQAALNPNSRIPRSGLSTAFVGLVLVTVIAVPALMIILNIVYCFVLCQASYITPRLRAVVSALNECNHILIFSFSVWLVRCQIESLSQEFSLPPELLSSVGLDKKDAGRSLTAMSLRLESGFFFVCCAGVVVELIGALDVSTTKTSVKEVGSSEELEQLKPPRRGPTYL